MESSTTMAAAIAGPPEERVESIPLGLCRPAPYNPRTFPKRPSDSLVELACSIRRTMQVQPAVVRPMKKGDEEWYEIVAGERRWRACSLRSNFKGLSAEQVTALDAAGPGPEHLRAVIRELTDAQAEEVCVVENLDRESLTPIEEAKGVEALMRLYRGDVEAVAARLNRNPAWVAMRVRLAAGLSPAWKKAIDEPRRGFGAWTAGHYAEVVRLDPVGQDALLRELHFAGEISVAQLRGMVTEMTRELGKAPFDVEDASLVPKCGACSSCPSTSASTPGLFADLGDEVTPSDLRKARCLNPVCWRGKVLAHAKAEVARLRKDHGDAALIFEQWQEQHGLPEPDRQKARHVSSYEYKPVEAGVKGGFPGVFFAGPKAGQVQWFKPIEHRSSGSGAGGGKAKAEGPKPLKERRADLDRRRQKAAVEAIAEAISNSEQVPTAEQLLALSLAFGTQQKHDGLWSYHYEIAAGTRERDAWRRFDALLAGEQADLLAELWRTQIRPVLLGRLTYTGAQCDVGKLLLNATRAGQLVGVDAEAKLAEAVAAIKEPKLWASLNAD